MKTKTKYIIAGVGLAALGTLTAASAYGYTLGRLMKMALDREPPKTREGEADMLAGTKGISEAMKVLDNYAEELKKRESHTVTIRADDGTKLVGHLIEAERPERLIIAMHGWRSSWCKDFGVIAPFWLSKGCSVLFAEQRGQGNSGGDYIGFGLLERFDCLRWAEEIDKLTKGRLPIYLCGVSMGATTVLMAAGDPLPLSVRGVVADCGFTSPKEIWKHIAEKNLHIPYRICDQVANDLCRRKINLGSDEYSCETALKNCAVPVLFIHGSDDTFVPLEMTFRNYKACGGKKHLFIVPGAGHGASYLVDKAGYEKNLLDFWELYDKGPTPV